MQTPDVLGVLRRLGIHSMTPEQVSAALALRGHVGRPDTPEERRAMARRYAHPTGGLLQPGWRR